MEKLVFLHYVKKIPGDKEPFLQQWRRKSKATDVKQQAPFMATLLCTSTWINKGTYNFLVNVSAFPMLCFSPALITFLMKMMDFSPGFAHGHENNELILSCRAKKGGYCNNCCKFSNNNSNNYNSNNMNVY